MSNIDAEITNRLLMVWRAMEQQPEALLPFAKTNENAKEQLRILLSMITCNEPALAYDVIIYSIEGGGFVFSGAVALALLELGLLFGYKTNRDIDAIFKREDFPDFLT